MRYFQPVRYFRAGFFTSDQRCWNFPREFAFKKIKEPDLGTVFAGKKTERELY